MSTPAAASPTFKARLRYWFDSTMSRGTPAIVAWLAAATLLLVIVGAVLLAVVAAADGEGGFLETTWLSLTRALDPGTMGGDAGWPFRLASLAITIAGIFVVSALIGVLSSGIDGKLAELRKGRSPVLETGHTLVLGWSPKLFTVLAELVVANANLPRSVVVVLAPRDKVEMEDEIRARVGDLGRTRVVCRTGDPADLGDLGIVNAAGARAVIVLRPDEDAGDAEVVRAVLGLLKGVPDPALRVVAEFADAQSAETISAASDGRVLTVVSTEIIALITAQVVRQAGLSSVYADLLDFDGDEIYFADAPSLIGQTFADALLAFEESAVIGLRRPDGRIALSPDPATVLERGDRVIAISSDDDTVVAGAVAVSRGPAPPGPPVVDAAPEHILVLGWNDLGPRVLANLDSHVAPGSTVRVVVDDRYVEPSQVEEVGGLAALRVEVVTGDTTAADCVGRATAGRRADHVMLLSYRTGIEPAESDARTLLTLLHVRRLLAASGGDEPPPSIATELLDVRNVELARQHDWDDFVVSERLTSLMMTQLAENPELQAVFTDLLDANGTDVRLAPAGSYVESGAPQPYAESVWAASGRGEVVIGYRLVRRDASGAEVAEVVLNPPKSRAVAFGADDQLIVLSAVPAAVVAASGRGATALSPGV